MNGKVDRLILVLDDIVYLWIRINYFFSPIFKFLNNDNLFIKIMKLIHVFYFIDSDIGLIFKLVHNFNMV